MEEFFFPASITALKNKAADLVHGEFPAAGRVQTDCQKLYQQLVLLEAVIEDAEERRRAEPAIDVWVNCLKYPARKADEVLEELKYTAIVNAQQTKQHRKLEQHSDYQFTFNPETELRTVMGWFKTDLADMSRYGLSVRRSQQAVDHVVDWPLIYKVDSTVIGRGDDLDEILGKVLGQEEMKEEVVVLPIVGESGIGKTTLAQLIYNNGKTQKHFDHRLWVCENDEFDVVRLVKSITDLVIPDNKLILNNRDLLFQTLRAELDGTRFLLVLDGVRNEDSDKWKQLMHLLDCGGPGSVVIVTTCCPEVASIVGTMDSYDLPRLGDEDLWEIFRLRAFGMGVEQQPKLAKIGMDILMKNCYGSPLVAKTLGGFMSYKKGEKEWLDVLEGGYMSYTKEERENVLDRIMDYREEERENVLDRIMDYREEERDQSEILLVLKRCYDDLPSHMKCCLAFCAIYPKNYEMERDTLIQLWMANSYIPLEKNMEIEEKGVEIFNELVWRGFLQDVKGKDNGVVCKMHHLIHFLVQSLVGREFASSLNWDQEIEYNFIHGSSFDEIDFKYNYIFDIIFESNYIFLRTVLLLPHGFRRDRITFSMFPVPVLSFHALSLTELLCRDIDPTKNRHLRYLDLSYCTNLEVLPESFSTLYCLQTLKLSHCIQLQCLPKRMGYMLSLRHVYLDGCYQLKHMPAGLGKLRQLQTLTMYLVNPDIGCGIGELKDLNLGGRVELYDLSKQENIEDAQQVIFSKRKLIQLYLSWESLQSDLIESDESNVIKSNPDTEKGVLQGLKPNENLEVLEIRQYNGTLFSDWMYDSRVLRNLTELILIKCRRCEALPPIWEFPSLQKLILIQLDNLKHVCNEGLLVAQGGDAALQKFAKLEHLSLVDMPNLESWLENDPAKEELASLVLSKFMEKGKVYSTLESLELSGTESLESWPEIDAEMLTSLAFPQLHELIILRCPKLDVLPSCPSLRVLEIAGETSIPSSLIEYFEDKDHVLVK